MEQQYFLYHLRLHNWLTGGGSLSSDLSKALKLPRSEALQIARDAKDGMGLTYIIVSEDDILAVRAQ